MIDLAVYGMGAVCATYAAAKAKRRIELSRAKHRSLAGHARRSRRLARLVAFYEFAGDAVFSSDDAPADVVARRKAKSGAV